MNITFYTMNTELSHFHSTSVPINKTNASSGSEAANYDKLTINSARVPADETSFARVLAREAASRLEEGVSSERVNYLKQQVRTGAYIPDARRIAEHMLGYRG